MVKKSDAKEKTTKKPAPKKAEFSMSVGANSPFAPFTDEEKKSNSAANDGDKGAKKKAPTKKTATKKTATKEKAASKTQEKAYKDAAGKKDKVEKKKEVKKNPVPLQLADVPQAASEIQQKVEAIQKALDANGGGGYSSEELEFMDPVAAARYRRPARLSSLMLYAVASFFVIALFWANWAEIDELTRGEGQVIPSGKIKTIDHLEGGIVQDILVTEGEEVNKGQILLRIDKTVSEAGYEESVQQFYLSRLHVERLRAQIEGKDFVIPEKIQTEFPALAESAMQRYRAAIERITSEQNIAQQELEQKKQELKETEARYNQQKEQLKLDQEELEFTEPLVKSGAASRLDLLNIKRRVNQIKGEIATTEASLTRVKASVSQADGRLKHVLVTIRNEELKELRETEQRLAEARDAITKERDRLTRTEVRSPVHGTVNELLVNTIGGVIQPGQDLLSIVPIEDSLLVEAKVSPADIAFLRPGMEAVVKVTAFDFSIYGGIEGKLVGISADAIKDERENVFFKVRIKTNRNYVKDRRTGQKLVITPGMVASVDILTGKRSILEYVLKPLKKGMHNALTER